MTARADKSALELMQLYWAACRQRGEKPKRVYGLVATKATPEYPTGFVAHWGCLRTYVEQLQERRNDAAAWEIQEFEPND